VVDQLALLSIIVATVAAPAIAARDPSARRGLKRMLIGLLVFNALYVCYLTLVHATFFAPQRW
jgi:hypothetical protein